MEKAQQELMFKLSMYEQQIQYLQQQLQAIEQGIMDITTLNIGLDELVGAEGKEIMAPVGRGIFIRSKILSEDLVVDIGGKNLVKKTIPETKEIIGKQIKKLEHVKAEIVNNLDALGGEVTEIINNAQEEEKKVKEKK